LVAVLIVWAFVLGVLVGQGSLATPEQVAALRAWAGGLPVVGAWFRESAPVAPPAPEEPKLSFYRELERRGQDVTTTTTAPRRASPTKGRYTVQVASFKERSQAQDLARRLAKAGLPAYVRAAEVRGVGRRYRVRVGPYPDLAAARAAAGRIRLQHHLAAFVTRAEPGDRSKRRTRP
jgi:cell division septation protein DedD